MKKKTYRYFITYIIGQQFDCASVGNVVLVYDEPLDTQQMIERARQDIAIMRDKSIPQVIILNFKRIKDNRY